MSKTDSFGGSAGRNQSNEFPVHLPVIISGKHEAGDGTVLLVEIFDQLVAPLAAVGLTSTLHDITDVDGKLRSFVIEVGLSLDGHILNLMLHNYLLSRSVWRQWKKKQREEE